MTFPMPVLTSIRSDWKAISEMPVLGKDVLELLSSSMYVNPLSIYREYVQNATDSIEEAVAVGLLSCSSEGRVEVTVDDQARCIRIRDNGTGIPQHMFVKRLIALGASHKRGRKARGFRGVGRLAGLGYCQELVFRSRADGEREVSELRWDCRRLKTILRDASFSDQLPELISQVVRTRKSADGVLPERFFEVELIGLVRHGADRLMNASAVSAYLSQVAPVPFSPLFSLRGKIEAALIKDVPLGNIGIFVNGSKEPLYRPHQDIFTARKGHQDKHNDVRIISLHGNDGRLAAIGWISEHGYNGAISADSKIAGLRLRCGNIQIGENDLLDELFQEVRFNAWIVGEIHVVDDRILPNGRRDNFEQSIHFNDLVNQLGPVSLELSRHCRRSSIQRNKIKQLQALLVSIETGVEMLEQGSITRAKRLEVKSVAIQRTAAVRKIIERAESSETANVSISLNKLSKRLDSITTNPRTVGKAANLSAKERRIFDALYEVLPQTTASKTLVDRVLARLQQ